MLSPTTFPSAVLGQPRGNIRVPQDTTPTKIMSGENPFHSRGRDFAHEMVRAKIRGNRSRENDFIKHGNWGVATKQDPIGGSYQMPFSATGNTGYGFQNAPGLVGSGGSLRTVPGSKSARELVRRRGQQLEEMKAMLESGVLPGVQPTQQVIPRTEESAEKTGVLLNLEELFSSNAVGDYSTFKAENLRKIFQAIVKIPNEFSVQEASELAEDLREVLRSLASAVASAEVGEFDEQYLPDEKSVPQVLQRIILALEGIVSTGDLESDPKKRTQAFKTYMKNVSKPERRTMGRIGEFIEPGETGRRLGEVERGEERAVSEEMERRGRSERRRQLTEGVNQIVDTLQSNIMDMGIPDDTARTEARRIARTILTRRVRERLINEGTSQEVQEALNVAMERAVRSGELLRSSVEALD